MPERIQRTRKKGWRMPPNTRCVTRPGRYGNPFRIGDVWVEPSGELHIVNDSETAIDEFRSYIRAKLIADPQFLEPLRGKNLACYCLLDKPCHADVLLELANEKKGHDAEKTNSK
jgi:hypothetical protein